MSFDTTKQSQASQSQAIADAIRAGAPTVDLSELPPFLNPTAETLTEYVHQINSKCPNPRLKQLVTALITKIHDLVREEGVTVEEWNNTIQFLTETGQTCSPIRQEFILLSDILGISALVDLLNNPKPKGACESTVLGPFFTADANEIPHGESIASEGKGEYMYVSGRVLDMQGNPIANAHTETWETDATGNYDTMYSDRDITGPDCRGKLDTDKDGKYAYRAVRPVPYPIPSDGPVGKLLRNLGRHVFRPSHLHIMVQAKGFEELVTSFYPEGDIYVGSDAVFGVKSSLIIPLRQVTDEAEAKAKGFKSAPFWQLERDIVMVDTKTAERLKERSLGHNLAAGKGAGMGSAWVNANKD